jgi:microcystin-dependent protein
MTSTYTPRLRLTQQGVNDNPDLWGLILNDVLALVDTAVAGITSIAMPDADLTLTTANGAADQARSAILTFSGTLTALRWVGLPAGVSKSYIVSNGCSQALNFCVGSNPNVVSIPPGRRQTIFTDGAGVYEPNTFAANFYGAFIGAGYLDATTLLQGGSPVWSPGDLKASASGGVPAGWYRCNGAAISRAANAALFAAIGTTYGAGDGSTTFNVPDLRGRTIAGLDNMGGGAPAGRLPGADYFGWTGGASTHTLSVTEIAAHQHTAWSGGAGSHSHTASVAANGTHNHSGGTADAGTHNHTGGANAAGGHAHSVTFPRANDGINQAGGFGNAIGAQGGNTDAVGDHTHSVWTYDSGNHNHTVWTYDAGSHTHGLTIDAVGDHTHAVAMSDTGGGGAHNNVQPTAAVNWLIKA